MTGIVNTAQADAWNGYEGAHWAAHADRYDAVNSGFNEILLAQVGPDDRVVDLGCGTGQLTRLAANRARHVLGVDLSEPMLATARARAADLPNVRFERGDVQAHEFGKGSFDVALSRFGVMFFADPVAAFARVRGALRPGGRLAFVSLTELAGTDLGVVFGAMAAHLPRPERSGPTSLADPAHVRALLAEAGFRDVVCTYVEAEQVWGRDVTDAAEFIEAWGPVRHHLQLASPEAAARARAALAAALPAFAGPGGVRLRGAAWLVTATR
ncbi:class I SAM-dependent methyltransferase [Amycolatopsis sp. FDAARGOS 1241]|uniref:class I SAM-dependent methyltransferase n=1 Tax=Amycolatopsis sp. FDAARGOS 1241 TaxID=2778070 RepID=UPI0019505F48|nr:class I SAM-dependent methyltransferase [Amycolatopsis sp. FDAARGOS 1241]QRP43262.1 class I SAM-dependent methyltransferase [Amycolatopsis sp. FDAARGOS 1241]